MKKNVILLSNAYYPSIGGIENSLRHLAEEAKTAGDNVKIIVSDLCVPDNYPNVSVDEINGITVLRYPFSPINNPFGKLFNLFLSNYLLYKLLKAEFQRAPDTLVIARFHFSAVIAKLVGFKSVRYVVPSIVRNQLKAETENSFFGKIVYKLRVFIHDWVQRKALLLCENFVFSESMLAQCRSLAGNTNNDYQITKPGVDGGRFNPLPAEAKRKSKEDLGLDLELPVVLFVGRFVKAKGADLLIKAIKEIKDCQLVIVGDGEEKRNYELLITELGLEDRVKLFPPTKNVERFYQLSDIFVMASNYEPLGQTILEAVSSGLYLVAFKKGPEIDTATQELGIDEYVYYAEKPNVRDLTLSLETALQALEEIQVDKIHRKAIELFSWSNLYKNLTKNQ